METVTITMHNQIAAAQSRRTAFDRLKGYLAFPGAEEPPPAFNRLALVDFAVMSEGNPDRDWDDYCPAYALGFLTYEAYCRNARGMAPNELQSRWEALRGSSRLAWEEVCAVIARSWHSLAQLERTGQL